MKPIRRICCGLAALAFAVAGCGRSPHPARDFQQGLAYFKEQKYAKAAPCFERVTRAVPGNAQALNFLGVCQLENGQATAAVQSFERALLVDDNYVAACYNLALAQLSLGHTEPAIALLRQVVRNESAPADASFQLGLAYMRGSAWLLAREAFAKYLAAAPNSVEALNAAGVVSVRLHDYQRGANDFAQAIAADPRFAPAYLNLAVIEHHRLDRPAEALAHYQKFLDLAPRDDHREAVRLAIAQIAREQVAQAKAAAIAAAKPAPLPVAVPTAPTTVAEAAPAPGPRPPVSPAPAPSVIAKPVEPLIAVPAPPPPPVKKVRVPIAAKPLKVGNRSRATVYFNKGVQLQQQGNLAAAIAAYESALAIDPSFAAAHYNQAIAYRASNQPDQALDQYELALAANPDYTDARFNYAILLQEQGYFDDAIAQYERIIKANPNDPAAHLSVASLYARNRSGLEKARQHYEAYVRLAPNSALARDVRRWLEQNR